MADKNPCNFDTIPPWKVVGTLYLDSSGISFKYVAFLSACDKFELLGHVQAAMMIWVLFSPFFLDSLLVTVSRFIGLFRWTCSSTFLLCKFWGLPGSTPVSFPVMRRWKCLGMTKLSQPISGNSRETSWQTCRNESRREASSVQPPKWSRTPKWSPTLKWSPNWPRNDPHFSSCRPRNYPQGIMEWWLNMGLWIAQ